MANKAELVESALQIGMVKSKRWRLKHPLMPNQEKWH